MIANDRHACFFSEPRRSAVRGRSRPARDVGVDLGVRAPLVQEAAPQPRPRYPAASVPTLNCGEVLGAVHCKLVPFHGRMSTVCKCPQTMRAIWPVRPHHLPRVLPPLRKSIAVEPWDAGAERWVMPHGQDRRPPPRMRARKLRHRATAVVRRPPNPPRIALPSSNRARRCAEATHRSHSSRSFRRSVNNDDRERPCVALRDHHDFRGVESTGFQVCRAAFAVGGIRAATPVQVGSPVASTPASRGLHGVKSADGLLEVVGSVGHMVQHGNAPRRRMSKIENLRDDHTASVSARRYRPIKASLALENDRAVNERRQRLAHYALPPNGMPQSARYHNR